MRNRSIVISIGLNLMLLGVLILCVKNSGSSARPTEAKVVGHSPKIRREARVVVSTNYLTSTCVARFNWQTIESEDYPTYIANLRAVRCPEKTIFDIIFADVEKLFAERKKKLETEQKFWLSGDAFAKADLAKETKIFELLEEKRALIQMLLHSELDWEVLEEWYKEKEFGLFMGFLPEGQPERVVSLMKKYIDRFEMVKKRGTGLVIPEDAAENQKVFAEMMTVIGGFVSPSDLEEGQLRMVALFSYLFSGSKLKEAKLTGVELRHLVKLRRQFADPFQHEVAKFDGQDTAPDLLAEQDFLNHVRQFLGENRFYDYLRAHDNEFEQLCNLVEKNGLQLQTASKVYEIQQAALLESTQVRESRSTTRKELREELQIIAQSSRDAVQKLIGEKAMASYSTNGGSWLGGIGKP